MNVLPRMTYLDNQRDLDMEHMVIKPITQRCDMKERGWKEDGKRKEKTRRPREGKLEREKKRV
ncbi:hypothetical protein MTR_3g116990 [Medicago truncatula]|uniref:Uncharacterized protein n=1 Tax=Medicago truncatula TaxID=3880 RepID=G7J756_MEDTR|nr:hypothetical protein MTR_3g116990 [Medicago truncatula]